MANETILVSIRRTDGTVALMSFLTKGRGSVLPLGGKWVEEGYWSREPTPAIVGDEIDRAMGANTVVSWRIVSPSELPADRSYRDALVDNGAEFSFDIEKCRAIRLARLRAERALAFPGLDAKWMQAVAKGDAKAAAEIEAKRQALRDAPADPRIASAKSVDDLKAISLSE